MSASSEQNKKDLNFNITYNISKKEMPKSTFFHKN